MNGAVFPSLCKPTTPVNVSANSTGAEPNRGLMVPKRRRTRAEHRAKRMQAERRLNDEYVAE
jgi:hypothetical protein